MSELIGYFGVDSGQVMIGDPCYLDMWKSSAVGSDDFTPGRNLDYSYLGACNASLSDKHVGVLDSGLAVVSATGFGDGSYPVYVTYSDEASWGRRVASLRIDFIDDNV